MLCFEIQNEPTSQNFIRSHQGYMGRPKIFCPVLRTTNDADRPRTDRPVPRIPWSCAQFWICITLLPLPYCLLYNWIFSFRHFVILLELDDGQSCYYILDIGGFWFGLELKSESQNQQKIDRSKQCQDISSLACISEYFINIII